MRSRVVPAALTAVLLGGWATAQSVTTSELKAAYLFNFAQFVDWSVIGVLAGIPLALCVVNDDAVADALDRVVKGRTAAGHGLAVKYIKPGAPLPVCHLLYLAGPDLKIALQGVETVKSGSVLTVSDAAHFATTGGMVELFIENDRMRFAVNVDTLQRAHIRLSSRVLALAKVVRDVDRQ